MFLVVRLALVSMVTPRLSSASERIQTAIKSHLESHVDGSTARHMTVYSLKSVRLGHVTVATAVKLRNP